MRVDVSVSVDRSLWFGLRQSEAHVNERDQSLYLGNALVRRLPLLPARMTDASRKHNVYRLDHYCYSRPVRNMTNVRSNRATGRIAAATYRLRLDISNACRMVYV